MRKKQDVKLKCMLDSCGEEGFKWPEWVVHHQLRHPNFWKEMMDFLEEEDEEDPEEEEEEEEEQETDSEEEVVV